MNGTSVKRRRLFVAMPRDTDATATSDHHREWETTYDNDCYDHVWYGKLLHPPSEQFEMNHESSETIRHDAMEFDSIYSYHHHHQQQHVSPPPPPSLVRSSWFHHVSWMSCSNNSGNSIINNSGTDNDNMRENNHSDCNIDNCEFNIDDSGRDQVPSINNHHDTTTTHHDDDNDDDRSENRLLQWTIRHLREQLQQVKRQLQPAVERYHHGSTPTGQTAGNHTHHQQQQQHQHSHPDDIFQMARRTCNPYEVLGEGQYNRGLNQYLFMNRSAIKLANIDAMLNVVTPATTSATTTNNSFKFCDLCGAPGGFSEYILWRLHKNYQQQQQQQQQHHQYQYHHDDPNENVTPANTIITSARGYGMSLMGQNEHGFGLPWKLQDYEGRPGDGRHYSHGFRTSYQICYGVDGTGDIYNWDNVESLQNMIYNDDIVMQKECENHDNIEHGKVHLVVVDGGFDAQRNTEYQEEVSLKLVVNETAAALTLLCTGGTFVIKLFGFQTSIVRTMMTHLYMSFDSVIAVKPISSRPASAERYVVGYGYHGHACNWSGQRWCNDLYLSRPCAISNYAATDINYNKKETELLRYLDEFDRDMYQLNLKATFAILAYIERKYLQRGILNEVEDGDDSEGSDADSEYPYGFDDDDDEDDQNVQSRINIPLYRMAWRLEN